MFFYLEQPIEKEILNVLIKIPLKKNRPQLQITELINTRNNTLFSKKVQNWDLPSKIDRHGEKEWFLLKFEQASNQSWKFYCSLLPKIGCRPSLYATMQIWFRKALVIFF